MRILLSLALSILASTANAGFLDQVRAGASSSSLSCNGLFQRIPNSILLLRKLQRFTLGQSKSFRPTNSELELTKAHHKLYHNPNNLFENYDFGAGGYVNSVVIHFDNNLFVRARIYKPDGKIYLSFESPYPLIRVDLSPNEILAKLGIPSNSVKGIQSGGSSVEYQVFEMDANIPAEKIADFSWRFLAALVYEAKYNQRR